MTHKACLVAAVLLATPAAALAAPGVITTSVNLRAGPSVEFPVVNRLPTGAPVEVHGCIRQEPWCDVSFQRERGWVAAQYLDYLYDGRYVDLPSYVVAADVPVVSFSLTSYWSSFYLGRPWYRRHAWWNRHWNTQTHVASQAPGAGPARMGNGMTAAGPAMGRGPNATPAVAAAAQGATQGATMTQGMNASAMRAPGGRVMPVGGAQDRVSGMRPVMTSGATGPANVMRGGGMPMAARAQFGGSRGGPGGGLGGGMPHAAMGGASQGGGAMHNGGGSGGHDGGGHRRH